MLVITAREWYSCLSYVRCMTCLCFTLILRMRALMICLGYAARSFWPTLPILANYVLVQEFSTCGPISHLHHGSQHHTAKRSKLVSTSTTWACIKFTAGGIWRDEHGYEEDRQNGRLHWGKLSQVHVRRVCNEFDDLVVYNTAHRLSRGEILDMFMAYVDPIKSFLCEQLIDALLTDISHHFNGFNVRLQGRNQSIVDLHETVKTFIN